MNLASLSSRGIRRLCSVKAVTLHLEGYDIHRNEAGSYATSGLLEPQSKNQAISLNTSRKQGCSNLTHHCNQRLVTQTSMWQFQQSQHVVDERVFDVAFRTCWESKFCSKRACIWTSMSHAQCTHVRDRSSAVGHVREIMALLNVMYAHVANLVSKSTTSTKRESILSPFTFRYGVLCIICQRSVKMYSKVCRVLHRKQILRDFVFCINQWIGWSAHPFDLNLKLRYKYCTSQSTHEYKAITSCSHLTTSATFILHVGKISWITRFHWCRWWNQVHTCPESLQALHVTTIPCTTFTSSISIAATTMRSNDVIDFGVANQDRILSSILEKHRSAKTHQHHTTCLRTSAFWSVPFSCIPYDPSHTSDLCLILVDLRVWRNVNPVGCLLTLTLAVSSSIEIFIYWTKNLIKCEPSKCLDELFQCSSDRSSAIRRLNIVLKFTFQITKQQKSQYCLSELQTYQTQGTFSITVSSRFWPDISC